MKWLFDCARCLVASAAVLGTVSSWAFFLVAGGGGADVSRAATIPAVYGEITRVYNWRGVLLGYVQGDQSNGWYVGTEQECVVNSAPHSYELYIGHTEVGAAKRKTPRRYEVWVIPGTGYPLPIAGGHQMRGYITYARAGKWNLLSRDGKLIGFTRGPAGPQAGVARFLLGSNLRNPGICQ